MNGSKQTPWKGVPNRSNSTFTDKMERNKEDNFLQVVLYKLRDVIFREEVLHLFVTVAFVILSFVVLFEPLICTYGPECIDNGPEPCGNYKTCQEVQWKNPLFQTVKRKRHPQLFWLTLDECDHGRRILFSALLGSVIGFERRSADRPAGIRTMSLVSIGACLFTLCSMFAFESTTMNWDASRVSAALPSGVGFIGGALIWKGSVNGGHHEVRGLTTATSVWLSAAIGMASGGGMYFTGFFVTISTVAILKWGPRNARPEDDDDQSVSSFKRATYDNESGKTHSRSNSVFEFHVPSQVELSGEQNQSKTICRIESDSGVGGNKNVTFADESTDGNTTLNTPLLDNQHSQDSPSTYGATVSIANASTATEGIIQEDQIAKSSKLKQRKRASRPSLMDHV